MNVRVICVLGMHRSGTSCLTGTLQEVGVFLGEVHMHNHANARGNRENRRIRKLHERILRSSGGRWDRPPPRARWLPEHRHARDAIIGSYAGQSCWGFKDPRAVFTIDGWQEKLPGLQLVGIFRHPLSVARSLQARNGFSIEKGLDLWALYNERLLHRYRQRPFPLLSFDQDEPELRAALSRVVRELHLDARAQPAFFDPDLRHQQDVILDPLPAHVQNLYHELNRIAA